MAQNGPHVPLFRGNSQQDDFGQTPNWRPTEPGGNPFGAGGLRGDGPPGGDREPPPPPQHTVGQSFGNVPEGTGGSTGPFDFEARLGDVLTKLKSDTIEKLEYKTGAKPVEFENWI